MNVDEERERARREGRTADYWAGWQRGRAVGWAEKHHGLPPIWWLRIKARFGR